MILSTWCWHSIEKNETTTAPAVPPPLDTSGGRQIPFWRRRGWEETRGWEEKRRMRSRRGAFYGCFVCARDLGNRIRCAIGSMPRPAPSCLPSMPLFVIGHEVINFRGLVGCWSSIWWAEGAFVEPNRFRLLRWWGNSCGIFNIGGRIGRKCSILVVFSAWMKREAST